MNYGKWFSGMLKPKFNMLKPMGFTHSSNDIRVIYGRVSYSF